MGLFPSYHRYLYILLVIDYVSKWVEEIATQITASKVIINPTSFQGLEHQGKPSVMVKATFVTLFWTFLKKYNNTSKVSISNHPQTS